VLESLEQEYKREEDWCGGADKLGPNCETDHVSPMISKHLEQKEAFLKVNMEHNQSKASTQYQGTALISLCVCVLLIFLSGVHSGEKKRRRLPQVHAQEQRQHARDAEPRQSTGTAG